MPVVMDLMDNKVCKMAMVTDPNGHSVMLHQMEPGRLKALQASNAGGASKPKAGVASKAKAGAAAKPKARAKVKPASTTRPRAAKAAGETRSAAKSRRRR